jgi:hypothetical protein
MNFDQSTTADNNTKDKRGIEGAIMCHALKHSTCSPMNQQWKSELATRLPRSSP